MVFFVSWFSEICTLASSSDNKRTTFIFKYYRLLFTFFIKFSYTFMNKEDFFFYVSPEKIEYRDRVLEEKRVFFSSSSIIFLHIFLSSAP